MSGTFLQDLVIVTVAATAVTIVFSRLRQPLVIGYLLAGVVIGPHFLPEGVVQDTARISELAELGLIFLMFALGLEFNLAKLRRHGAVALFIAAVEVGAMIGFGFGLGRFLGWGVVDSLFLGAIVASTSTTILVKVLLELGLIQEEFAQVTIGVTIIEDLLVIVVALMLQMGAGAGGVDVASVGVLLLQLGLFLAITLSVGIVGVPRFIEWVSRHAVDEVLVITVVGLAFAGAMMATSLGFSLSLGAFLMGAMVAESRAVRKVESRVVPIRDLFSSLFFVAVGMLLDPAAVVEQWRLVLLITLVAVLGKVVANWAGALVAGYDGATSLRVGLAMAQMGEWSLIVAALGLSLGTMSEAIYPATVAACSITMLVAPFILRASGPVSEAVSRLTPGGLSALARRYRAWLTAATGAWEGPGGRASRDPAYTHRVNLFLFGSWIFGLFLAGFAFFGWVEGSFGHLLPLTEEGRRTVSLAAVGLLGLPLFFAFARAVFGWYAVRWRHASLRPGSLVRQRVGRFSGRAFAFGVAAAAAVALPVASLGVAIVMVRPLALPGWPLAWGAFLLVGACAVVLGRRLVAVSRWLEGALVMLRVPGASGGGVSPLQQIRSRCPWGVEAIEVEVSPRAQAAVVGLSDRALRARTGAVVLATVRGNQAVSVKPGEFVARPGERVILVGSPSQLERARNVLQGPAPSLGVPTARA